MAETVAVDKTAVHVVGASGRSGLALCRSLMADGIDVVAVVRDLMKWRKSGLDCPVRIADLEDPAAIAAALRDANRVVSCAHAGYSPVILAAASLATRFVFLGSTRKFTRWPDSHARRVIAGEASFLSSGRHGVILHPTMIYGATGENNVQRLAKLLRLLPIVLLPSTAKEALVQPIHQDDVTASVRAALDIPWSGPNSIVIAGPQPLRYIDFIQAVAKAAGIEKLQNWSLPLAPLMAIAAILKFVPGIPKVDPAELRRLLEDKSFDIRMMRRILKIDPRPLTVGLASTFSRRAPDKSMNGFQQGEELRLNSGSQKA